MVKSAKFFKNLFSLELEPAGKKIAIYFFGIISKTREVLNFYRPETERKVEFTEKCQKLTTEEPTNADRLYLRFI